MREIKFRAWDGEFMWKQSNLDELNVEELRKGVACDSPTEGEQTMLTVMQYTGLKDNKRTKEYPEGQEIYEGDIVNRFSPPECYNINRNTVVTYSSGCFLFIPIGHKPDTLNQTYRNTIFYDSSIKIIGNIYENPELLEKINADSTDNA